MQEILKAPLAANGSKIEDLGRSFSDEERAPFENKILLKFKIKNEDLSNYEERLKGFENSTSAKRSLNPEVFSSILEILNEAPSPHFKKNQVSKRH